MLTSVEQEFILAQIASLIHNVQDADSEISKDDDEASDEYSDVEHFIKYMEHEHYFMTSAKVGIKTSVASCVLLHLYRKFIRLPQNVVFKRRFEKIKRPWPANVEKL